MLCNPTLRPWNVSNMQRVLNAKANQVAKKNSEQKKKQKEQKALEDVNKKEVDTEKDEHEILLVSDAFDNKMEETNV